MTRLRAGDALALFAGALALWVAVGPLLPGGTAGLVAGEVLLLALPAVLFARVRAVPVRDALGLHWPRPGAITGAALVGVSFWFLNLLASVPILAWFGIDAAELAEVDRRAPWVDDAALVRVAAVAIVPAVCEELLLRGAIARSLRPAFGAATAIAVSALLFAALHHPPLRMLPAGLFGLALGYAAVVSDSVVSAMVAHFANNLMAVVVLPACPVVLGWCEDNPGAAGVVCAAVSAAGAALLWRSRVSPTP
jgi:sodium transport system permease protein